MSTKSDINTSDSGGASERSEPQGVLGLALELLRSEEKSAADREAKLAVLRFIETLKGRGDDYLKGYREGYTQGFKDGYHLRVVEEEADGHRYGDV